MKLATNHRQPTASQPPAGPPSLTPTIQLIIQLRDNPLALGLLCFIQRLFLIHQAPIPLSAADVAAGDPGASPQAVRRALTRLIRAGGLVADSGRGAKRRCLPGWGLVNGQPRPWDRQRKMYNRPTHLPAVRLDIRIFDYFLGRLILHERLPALAERYVTAPLLGLRDIGALLLLEAGLPAPAESVERLSRCGLVRGGRPCALPADGDDILRWVSQNQLGADAPTLSDKGLRRLGLPPKSDDPPPPPTGQPLVYLDPEHYHQTAQFAPQFTGCCAGRLAGLNRQKQAVEIKDSPSPEADKIDASLGASDFTWNLKHKKHESTLPSGGGGLQQKNSNRRRKPTEPLPETPTAKLLQELGARPASIRELCHIDSGPVEGIIAYGRSRGDVRSLAGWVVQALREHRDHGWTPPAPVSPNADMFDADKYACGGYPSFQRQEPAPAAAPSAPAEEAEELALRDRAEPAVLMEWIARTLKRMFRQEHYGLLDRLRLIDAGDAPVFSCGTAEDVAALADGLDYYVARLCQDFGWAEPPRFVLADALFAGDEG